MSSCKTRKGSQLNPYIPWLSGNQDLQSLLKGGEEGGQQGMHVLLEFPLCVFFSNQQTGLCWKGSSPAKPSFRLVFLWSFFSKKKWEAEIRRSRICLKAWTLGGVFFDVEDLDGPDDNGMGGYDECPGIWKIRIRDDGSQG